MNPTSSKRNPAPILFSLADQSFSRTKSVGILNVSVGLARALTDSRPAGGLVLFSNEELRGCLRSREGAVTVRPFHRAAASRWGRIWYDQVGVYRAARLFPGSWLLLPKGFASFLLPPPRGIRLACYVHDTMQAHYRRHHPEFFPRFERAYFWRGFLATLRRAHLILTNSRFTADEVTATATSLQCCPGPIVPVGIGFEVPPPVPMPAARSGLLVLASRMPHKLTAQAVAWLRRWQSGRRDYLESVHWVGSLPAGLQLPAGSNWRQLSRLDDGEYHELMNRARVLIYFSEYEGFGMPPVEAVFRGVAPVYSDIPATREVMNRRGMPFENQAYDSFAAALDRALACAPAVIRDWGAELAAELRWSDVAQRTLDAMSRVTSG